MQCWCSGPVQRFHLGFEGGVKMQKTCLVTAVVHWCVIAADRLG